MTTTIRRRLAKLEEVASGNPRDDLTDAERALVLAHHARCDEREGRTTLTAEQRALLAEPGAWHRLQQAFNKPAFAGRIIEALDRDKAEWRRARRAGAQATTAG
jgi:hypothetical protein